MTKSLINIDGLYKTYKSKNLIINIFEDIQININHKDIVAIVGPSGIGKTTLLNIIGLIDNFDSGNFLFDDLNVLKMNKKTISNYRNKNIGFVHQFFHLIPELNVVENVAIPKLIHSNKKKESYEYSEYLLEKFKLKDKIFSKPSLLSGGEQQRVAIARSLINKPSLLIADEMTGNLDEDTSDEIFDFFIKEIKKNNQTLLFATHNLKYAKKSDFVFEIKKKKIFKI